MKSRRCHTTHTFCRYKKRLKNSKKFIFPANCPSCGSKTLKEFNKITKKQMQLEDVLARVIIVIKYRLKN